MVKTKEFIELERVPRGKTNILSQMLDDAINKWAELGDIKILDIKYNSQIFEVDNCVHLLRTALILYQE